MEKNLEAPETTSEADDSKTGSAKAVVCKELLERIRQLREDLTTIEKLQLYCVRVGNPYLGSWARIEIQEIRELLLYYAKELRANA